MSLGSPVAVSHRRRSARQPGSPERGVSRASAVSPECYGGAALSYVYMTSVDKHARGRPSPADRRGALTVSGDGSGVRQR
jgi:hypothetical protein